MKKDLLFVIIIFIILCYLLINIRETTDIKNENFIENTNIDKYVIIKYRYKSNNYYITSNQTKILYLTDNIKYSKKFILSKYEEFYNLKEQITGMYMKFIYTKFHKNIYDIILSDGIDNTALLNIKKYKNKFYIKFYNGYYLSIDNDGNLYSSREKKNILLFKFKKISL